MCITFGPAHLSSTLLYAAEVIHDGRIVHVLGYQNSAKNLAPGPNAMILPFPTAEPMTSANILDTSQCPNILLDYAASLKQRSDRRSRGLGEMTKGVQVFDSGNFTVVLADRPTDIPKALQLVPEARRPEPNTNVLAAFERIYPGWPIALCCFNTREMAKPDPLLWWYVPKNKDQLFMPALDAHDGGPPKLDAMVDVDHTVMVGSYEGIAQDTDYPYPEVNFKDRIPMDVGAFLVNRVVGMRGGIRGHRDGPLQSVDNGAGFQGQTVNGDFVIPIADVRTRQDLDANAYRVSPSHG